jgi:hypothetical protein
LRNCPQLNVFCANDPVFKHKFAKFNHCLKLAISYSRVLVAQFQNFAVFKYGASVLAAFPDKMILAGIHTQGARVKNHLERVACLQACSVSKTVNREDKRSRRYRDRDFAKFERSRRYRDR